MPNAINPLSALSRTATQRTEEAFRQSFHCGAPRHTRKKDTVSRADHRTAIERLLKQRAPPARQSISARRAT